MEKVKRHSIFYCMNEKTYRFLSFKNKNDFGSMQKISSFTAAFTGLGHGRIIKWTHHIGFLTLAEIEQVIEGNHGNVSKEGSKYSVLIAVWRNFIIGYIFIFMSLNITNACTIVA